MIVEKYNTNFGDFKAFKNCKEITRALRENRMFHPEIMGWIENHIHSDSTFIDIGSNIGIYSIYIAKKYKNTHTISVEAHPEVFGLLKENKNLNNIDNIDVVNLAASNVDGDILKMSSLVEPIKEFRGNFGDNRIGDGSLNVASVRVDSISIEKPVSVIKIDVQGYDYYALLGCENIIKKYKPVIIIEWEQEMIPDKNVNFSHLENYMNKFGYKLIKSYNKDFLFMYDKKQEI